MPKGCVCVVGGILIKMKKIPPKVQNPKEGLFEECAYHIPGKNP